MPDVVLDTREFFTELLRITLAAIDLHVRFFIVAVRWVADALPLGRLPIAYDAVVILLDLGLSFKLANLLVRCTEGCRIIGPGIGFAIACCCTASPTTTSSRPSSPCCCLACWGVFVKEGFLEGS